MTETGVVTGAHLGPGATADATRLRYLDGFRGLAALAVVFFHVTGRSRWVSTATTYGVDPGAWVERLGNYAVCVFFLLSGLVLYRPFVEAALRDEPAPRYGPFIMRRLARILPAYLVAITVFYALDLGSAKAVTAREYVYQYLFLQNYVRRGFLVSLPVSWSLCIEMAFYVSLPLLALGIRRLPGARQHDVHRRLQAQLIGLGLMALVAWGYRSYVLYQHPRWPGSPPNYLPATLDWFALGMLLAVLHCWRQQGGRLPGWFQALADRPLVCWALAIEVYWLSVQLHIPPDFMTAPGKTLARFAFNGLSSFLLLLPAVLCRRPARALRALERPEAVFLGTISYGIYLWHPILLRLSDRIDLTFAIHSRLLYAVVTTIPVAYLSYRFVERPVIDRQRRWARRHRPARLGARSVAAA